jgi:hypothetical protein
LIGWEHFNVHIVEVCDKGKLGERENFFLQNYLPLLNSVFSSSFTEQVINQTLLSKLEGLRYNTNQTYKRKIYVYEINKGKINPKFTLFNDSIEASDALGFPRTSIFRYKNTSIPYRGKLLYSNKIGDLKKEFLYTQKITPKGLVNQIKPVKVWAYDALTLKEVDGSPFLSINKASAALGIGRRLIDYILDTGKAEGVKGTCIYSRQLKSSEIKNLVLKNANLKIGNNIQVWVYKANTLELINNTPFLSISDAAAYFKVNYRTISRKLDTKKATYQDGSLVYFFKKEIDSKLREELMAGKTPALVSSWNIPVWVYDAKTLELVNNSPFENKNSAASYLNTYISTIQRNLDTSKASRLKNKTYYYFFSKEWIQD